MKRAPSKRLGYTVLEVMMSLAVLTVGAGGVIAMQKATALGNTSARNVATANALAESWAERLRAESLMWNAPNGANDLPTDTRWLKSADASPPVWVDPDEIVLNPGSNVFAGSPSADIIGSDIYPGNSAQPAFCTKVRLMRLAFYPNPSNAALTTSRTIRAEIRVFWDRGGAPLPCASVPDPESAAASRYGSVSITTAIAQNTAPP